MKVSVASGGFDPIHSGHIAYLIAAKKQGDKLIVALNSDDWLTNKKGQPFMSFEERKTILENFDLKLNNGQILGLLGPNGVGKSTIFNLITGLISPDYGSIIINSKKVNDYPISERATKFNIGFVPQTGGYFYDLTVFENLKAIAEIKIDNRS